MFEIYAEMERSKPVKSEVAQTYYSPSAIYFFVHKDNLKLYGWLTYALTQMISTGQFEQLLIEYPAHNAALKKAELSKRKIIKLENPDLPQETPIGNKSLWYAFPES